MAASMKNHGEKVNSILKIFSTAARAPEKFVSIQKKLGDYLTSNTKDIFDLVNNQSKEHDIPACPLDELLIEGFDEEQIWQEIELLNTPSQKQLLRNISDVIARKHKLTFRVGAVERTGDNVETGDDPLRGEELDGDEEPGAGSGEDRLQGRRSSGDDDDDVGDDDSDTNFDIDVLEGKSRSSRPGRTQRVNTFRPVRTVPSVVDDRFFKLSEMERFLEMEDEREERKRREEEEGKGSEASSSEGEDDDGSDGEDFDYFEELPSSGEEDGISESDDEIELDQEHPSEHGPSSRDMKHSDYFPDPEGYDGEGEDSKHEKRVKFTDEADLGEEGDGNDEEEVEDLLEDAQVREYLAMRAAEASDSEGEDADDILGRTKPGEEKSTFEQRQERVKERIQQLEESNISEKPWQMVGEVGGVKRPDNSLLEERLDFEVATKPAPVITEETTQDIESLIRQRILDRAWDDVERKIKPKEEAFEFKKRITLDQEKSKQSLGEIYEQEYLHKIKDKPDEEEEDPAHAEIRKMMDSLFVKLDALTNYHFAPKPAIPELKIVSNAPAISMEDVQPISVADATLLAPEEVKDKSRAELKGDTEKTTTDRKRERRQKKKGQHLRAKEREKKEGGKAVSKESKKSAMEKLERASRMPANKTSVIKDNDNTDKKLLTSSKAFFSKLQEEAVAEVKGHQKRKKSKEKTVSSKKLKL